MSSDKIELSLWDSNPRLWERLNILRDRRVGVTDDERRAEETLPVKLTDPELLDMGKDSAQTASQIAALERDLESAKKRVKADIEALQGRVTQNNEWINTGKQDRTVQVITVLDEPRRGYKATYRLDTLELVRTTTMTHEETQRLIKFEEAHANATGPVPAKPADTKLPTRPKKDKGKPAPVEPLPKEPHWNGYLIVVKDGKLFAGESLPDDEAERCAHQFGHADAAAFITKLEEEGKVAVADPAPAAEEPAPGLRVVPDPAPEAEPASETLPPIGGTPAAE